MKKIISALLAAAVIFSLMTFPASAGRDFSEAEKIASELKEQGLFMGTDKGFELDRAPTRAEALVMLLRSLGKEAEAKAYTGNSPFSDAKGHWAEKYIAYAYKNGLTNGVSSTVFGVGDKVSSSMYLTFVLRALDYTDKNNTDFSWKDPYSLAKAVGILPLSAETEAFLRADAALISGASLSALMKGGYVTLADKLGLSEIPFQNGPISLTVNDINELYGKLNWALSEFPENIEIIPAGKLKYKTVSELLDMCVTCSTTYCSYIECSYYEGSNIITLIPEYSEAALAYACGSGWRDKAEEKSKKVLALLDKADAILQELKTDSLTEEQSVRAIHDYIASHSAYDSSQSGENSYSAYGVLVGGTGVCDGYSYAFWLLCRLAGLDCIRVSGEAENKGSHSWNKVKTDDKWHNVDVTWDDPVYYYNGKLTDTILYDYYLIDDGEIVKDHTWTQYTTMPVCG